MALFGEMGCGMWSLMPYDKCDFRCVYCCTGAQGVSKTSVPEAELLAAVRHGLAAVSPDELVILGCFSDAYPNREERLGITRAVLEELVDQNRRILIVTKSRTILRDIDLLQRHRNYGRVQISICSTDNVALKRLDPGAPSVDERFATLRTLAAAGIEVGLNALPLVPGVSDVEDLLARTPAGVEIIFGPLTIGDERDELELLGRRHTRSEAVAWYLTQYRRWGHLPHTSWVRPSPPPAENNPLYRLPVLPVPDAGSPAAAPASLVLRMARGIGRRLGVAAAA